MTGLAADAGDFPSAQEIKETMGKWGWEGIKWLKKALQNLNDEAAATANENPAPAKA
jgi:hypothetical protein